jgi:DNA polymerase
MIENLRFNVADLNAIETRVGAWLSGCTSLTNVFQPYYDPLTNKFYQNGKDPYLDFASKMYAIPYDVLWADYCGLNGEERKLEAKRKRQIAKPGVLGAIYRLSGGGWGWSKNSYKDHTEECLTEKWKKKNCPCPEVRDRIKIGLWGYSANMGVDMTQEQASEVVKMFREAYAEIPAFWKELEDAVIFVMDPKHPARERRVGPNGCVKIDKLNVNGWGSIMRMQLPSGRYLHYLNARIEDCKMPWTRKNDNGEDEDVYRPALVYAGEDQITHQWDIWIQTHGGKLFENLVQAIARDILARKLLKIEALGGNIVAHVHDEGVGKVINDPFSMTVEDMVRIMSEPDETCPGLLLGADGFSDSFYHK